VHKACKDYGDVTQLGSLKSNNSHAKILLPIAKLCTGHRQW